MGAGELHEHHDEAVDPVRAVGPSRFSNRELSRLAFADRLLDLAEDPSLPLLERVKFTAIYADLLDEFFQVRVANLEDQMAAGITTRSPDGLRPKEQQRAIRARVLELVDRQDRVVCDQLLPELAEAGIAIVSWEDLAEADQAILRARFEREMFPVLTPLSVDVGHPFPYISDRSLNLLVRINDPVSGETRVARVKVPDVLSRFCVLDDGARLVPLEQVLAACVSALFPGMSVGQCQVFRITRNADLVVEEDEADDLLVAIEAELRRRRFGHAVRLELAGAVDEGLRDLLVRELDLREDQVYVSRALLGLPALWGFMGLERPDLKSESWSPQPPAGMVTPDAEPLDLFALLREGDVLVQHPYDSFAMSVEAFIAQAAEDPDVLGIKQTLYRTSGNSPIVAALVRAAELGKQVAVVVELKARFDEAANIGWAKALEDAGVHVVYGLVGLKTHSKTCLVLRREADGIRRYCHVGTGNYNSKTARQYEDLGIFTADPGIGEDVGHLFNYLTGFSHHATYRHLAVSPVTLRSTIVELIEREQAKGAAGRIRFKLNGLTDPKVIDALYRAAQAGVPVELCVRSLCCIRPGVPGLSEGITVRSIVGEFLEHSRIYAFGGTAQEAPTIYVGSADLMERNLDRRIEVLIPVVDPRLQARVLEILDLVFEDDQSSWLLDSEGQWTRAPRETDCSVQETLKALATDRSTRWLDLTTKSFGERRRPAL